MRTRHNTTRPKLGYEHAFLSLRRIGSIALHHPVSRHASPSRTLWMTGGLSELRYSSTPSISPAIRTTCTRAGHDTPAKGAYGCRQQLQVAIRCNGHGTRTPAAPVPKPPAFLRRRAACSIFPQAPGPPAPASHLLLRGPLAGPQHVRQAPAAHHLLRAVARRRCGVCVSATTRAARSTTYQKQQPSSQ